MRKPLLKNLLVAVNSHQFKTDWIVWTASDDKRLQARHCASIALRNTSGEPPKRPCRRFLQLGYVVVAWRQKITLGTEKWPDSACHPAMFGSRRQQMHCYYFFSITLRKRHAADFFNVSSNDAACSSALHQGAAIRPRRASYSATWFMTSLAFPH